MKIRVAKHMKLGAVIASVAIALLPLMANAEDPRDAQIRSLKQQIYNCRHHKRHHRRAKTHVLPKVVEKKVIIEREKPVFIEKVIEKQVTVEKPAKKEIVLEQPAIAERKVVVQHSAHRKHLLHLGIPFIGVTLF